MFRDKKKIFGTVIVVLLTLIFVFFFTKGDKKIEKEKSKPFNADVITDSNGEKTDGISKVDKFHKKVEKGENAKIRILQYSVEGAPLIRDITFDGKNIKIKNDETRDKFSDTEIENITCKHLFKTENGEFIEYRAGGCDNALTDFQLLYKEN